MLSQSGIQFINRKRIVHRLDITPVQANALLPFDFEVPEGIWKPFFEGVGALSMNNSMQFHRKLNVFPPDYVLDLIQQCVVRRNHIGRVRNVCNLVRSNAARVSHKSSCTIAGNVSRASPVSSCISLVVMPCSPLSNPTQLPHLLLYLMLFVVPR